MRLTALPSPSTSRGRSCRRRAGWSRRAAWRPAAGRSARRARPRTPGRAGSSTGHVSNAGSVRWASRSAIASFAASMPRWIQPGSVTPSGPNARGAGGSNCSRIAEQLERDDAGAVRRVGRDPDAAVVDRDRLAPASRCGPRRSAAVMRRSRRRPAPAPGARRGRRRRRRRSRRGPASRASPRAPAGGRARPAARAGRAAGRPRRTRRRARALGDDRRGPLDRVDEPVPGREAVPCQLDGRGQDASRDSRPNRAWASPHERTAPGTVIVSGPRRGSVGRARWPAAPPASAREPAPARSR